MRKLLKVVFIVLFVVLSAFVGLTVMVLSEKEESFLGYYALYTDELFAERVKGVNFEEIEKQEPFTNIVSFAKVKKVKLKSKKIGRHTTKYSTCVNSAWRYVLNENKKQKILLPNFRAKIYEMHCLPEEAELHAVYYDWYKNEATESGVSEEEAFKQSAEVVRLVKQNVFKTIAEAFVQ